jgi:hypothetical protein
MGLFIWAFVLCSLYFGTLYFELSASLLGAFEFVYNPDQVAAYCSKIVNRDHIKKRIHILLIPPSIPVSHIGLLHPR